MYRLDVSELEQTVPVGGDFLDVGCAEGVFLTCLSDRWTKYGIDVSREAVDRAVGKPGIHADTRDIVEFEDSAFDVIHLRGVFEHILDPTGFISVACRKLRPTGYLIISNTPNIRGIVPRLFRGRFRLVIPNEHVNYHSVRSLRVLAAKNGLKIVKVTYPYWQTPYRSFYRDLIAIPVNYLAGKPSPPFWGNILTAYMTREGATQCPESHTRQEMRRCQVFMM